jgi:hypothetical protein
MLAEPNERETKEDEAAKKGTKKDKNECAVGSRKGLYLAMPGLAWTQIRCEAS